MPFRWRVGLSCIWLLLPSAGRAQNAGVAAVRTAKAPSLDGVVDESWSAAAIITEFHQREPFEGRVATEETIVRILYDDRYLYFGFECHDSEPGGIVATELRRDTDFTV